MLAEVLNNWRYLLSNPSGGKEKEKRGVGVGAWRKGERKRGGGGGVGVGRNKKGAQGWGGERKRQNPDDSRWPKGVIC